MEQVISKIDSQNYSFVGEIEETNARNEGVKLIKWTQKEYYKMAELGFFHNRRVELIEGEIIEMSPMKSAHATALALAAQILAKIFPQNFVVRTQMPLNFGKANAPEPDLAIIKGNIRDFSKSHPKTAELLIEVSDSTLRYDRAVKAELYAQNRIREYWIVNLKNRRLEVYRQPKKDKNLGFVYGEIKILIETESIAPLAAPKSKIKIADILP